MELIAVGRILRPQGRRGEVRVEALTDEPGRLAELSECYLVPPEAGELRRIEAVWFQGPVPVLKLAGSDSISEAEALGGRLVAIPRGAARPLPADHFYAFDLIGCVVRTPEGRPLGAIRDVTTGPAHDFWIVRAGEREWLLPAVSAIVERVDLRDRLVVVRPPDGLVELDEA
ncbi:MAG TPA: ribosome maturation factor RimM [Methylomirabilota bacterium]|nr:ribosome maturation factor RimM [Methylomirabilota bacterium]